MSDFHPGEGWRKIRVQLLSDLREGDVVQPAQPGDPICVMRREEPVPPLPTEPYTVIRTRLGARDDFFMKMPSLIWRCLGNEQAAHTDEQLLAEMVTGFEVLAWPASTESVEADRARVRSETAMAVLDRISDLRNGRNGTITAIHEIVAREFGVEA